MIVDVHLHRCNSPWFFRGLGLTEATYDAVMGGNACRLLKLEGRGA